MMLDTLTLARTAGMSGLVAVVALIAAAVALGLFFGGAGEAWGPVNDVLTSLMLIALIPPILAVERLAGGQTGGWLGVVTVAAVVGAVIAAVGQVLLVIGVIDLNMSYVTGGIGFAPILIWIVAVGMLGVAVGALPAAVGWLALATLGLIVLASAVTAVTRGPIAWAAWVGVVAAFAIWLGGLSGTLLDRAAA
jgi:hypothetical protein